MKHNRKASTLTALSVFILIGIVASKPPEDKYKNLKVLPKNISEETMDKVMDEFEKALGVGCDFCHAQSKTDTSDLDFASDERPEKLVARKMITMTNKINKEYFNGSTKYGEANAVMAVQCMTCHHGEAHPEIKVEEEEKKQ